MYFYKKLVYKRIVRVMLRIWNCLFDLMYLFVLVEWKWKVVCNCFYCCVIIFVDLDLNGVLWIEVLFKILSNSICVFIFWNELNKNVMNI